MEVWVANADGSSPAQLTHVPGGFQGDPAWSPDGRLIAFESARPSEEHPHIWTVDSEGGTPRQITQGTGDQMCPTWSRDGEWIYFSWSRSDGRDIWRVRVRTGSTERVTRGGGFIARESADGRTLFYISKSAHSPVMAQPLAGGAPRAVVACVAGTAFSVNPQGIYYVPCADGADAMPIPIRRCACWIRPRARLAKSRSWNGSISRRFHRASPCRQTAGPSCTAGWSGTKPT